jgi:hypothetical protein
MLLAYHEQIEAGAIVDDNFSGKSLDNLRLRFDLLLR